MRKRSKAKKPIAIITAIALAFSLAVAPGIASADGDLTAGSIGTDVPEWAVDDGTSGALTAQAELSASFDMRDNGWVTPVKQQGPWQTC